MADRYIGSIRYLLSCGAIIAACRPGRKAPITSRPRSLGSADWAVHMQGGYLQTGLERLLAGENLEPYVVPGSLVSGPYTAVCLDVDSRPEDISRILKICDSPFAIARSPRNTGHAHIWYKINLSEAPGCIKLRNADLRPIGDWIAPTAHTLGAGVRTYPGECEALAAGWKHKSTVGLDKAQLNALMATAGIIKLGRARDRAVRRSVADLEALVTHTADRNNTLLAVLRRHLDGFIRWRTGYEDLLVDAYRVGRSATGDGDPAGEISHALDTIERTRSDGSDRTINSDPTPENTGLAHAEAFAAQYRNSYAVDAAIRVDGGWHAFDTQRGWQAASQFGMAPIRAALAGVIRRRCAIINDAGHNVNAESAINGPIFNRALIHAADLMRIHTWDSDASLLGVDDGRNIDILTGAICPADSQKYVRMRLGCAPDNARMPDLLELLKILFQGDSELITWLQSIVGSTLLGRPQKRIYALVGPKDTGKTTLLNLIHRAFGEYARPVSRRALVGDDHDTVLADFAGRRFTYTEEFDRRSRWNTSRLKLLTSAGMINARRISGNPFSFKPTHVLFIGTNHLPLPEDADDALISRIVVIPMRQVLSADWADRANALAPALLAWTLEGARRFKTGAPLPSAVQQSARQYAEDADPLGTWLNTALRIESGAYAAHREIRNQYAQWRELSGGAEKLTDRHFSARIREWIEARPESGVTKVRHRDGVGYRNLTCISDTPDPPDPRPPDTASVFM